ncbi:ACL183Wp [Eremothecium gossypii ATCC 10895]|uniref:Mitochondrial import inner membrane translocase subunit TIM21 n=1 Tax=Eremothecium gossypii (strain ATCC 10895 / CBS 109.51 / FGSC 9923 / NRRL Y-1056) TaxID=284811 RepID=TIM21_EREGS|nr:ACL183Wp [Eremothecium gossypii ATCC 10895]Q75CX4.1 RecName: Full=Mitochondrial import inner membrane translocase subunit TIM21; Flags: Precursor [Eremothecium gossypii ATCC 10895]AAS51045.1 ACL183Wp [Eremothecium gossypii ATCC 10895]AEY95335.1 FACL183Wp [Eremothecium gossypii FDAG1]
MLAFGSICGRLRAPAGAGLRVNVGKMPGRAWQVANGQPYSTFYAPPEQAGNRQKERRVTAWKKVRAAATFSASGMLVLGAAGVAGIVLYLILSELFSPSGDTQIFNRAVSTVEGDAVARSLLQCEDGVHRSERLKAYGDSVGDDRWTRNRPISSTRRLDASGREHYYMRFHVETGRRRGVVSLEAQQSDDSYQPEFVRMYLDVPGEKRHYLIRPEPSVAKPKGFLGLNWGPRKD